MARDVVEIQSDGQSMWGPGAANILTWDYYVPLIGGDRTKWDVTGATVVSAPHRSFKIAKIDDGDIVLDLPKGRVDLSESQRKEPIVVEITLQKVAEDGETGEPQTMTRTVEITPGWKSSPLGERLVTLQSDDTGVALKVSALKEGQPLQYTFSGVSAAEMLQSPHSFTGDEPAHVIDIDIDVAASVRDTVTGVIDAVRNIPAKMKAWVENQVDKIVNSAAGQWVQEKFVATALKLESGWEAAKEKVPLLQDVQDFGSEALETAGNAVETIEREIKQGLKAADDLLDLGRRQITKIIDKGFSFITRLFDSIVEERGNTDAEIAQIEAERSKVEELKQEQKDAEKALDAGNKLAGHLGETTIDDAQKALDDAKKQTAGEIGEVRDAMAGLDTALGNLDEAVAKTERQLNRSGGEVTDKITGLFDNVVSAARKIDPLALLNDILDKNNLTVKAKVDLEADAQAGVLFEAKIDPGSVDSNLKYDVETTVTYDAGTDMLFFDVESLDALLAGDEAFSTQFPYLTFTVDIVYDVGGSIDVDFEGSLKLDGEMLLEIPQGGGDPLHYSKELRADGKLNIVDIDTRELELEVEPIPDVLTVTLRGPNLTTSGTKVTDYRDEYDAEKTVSFEDFVRQAFDDPDATDFSQIAERLVNLLKPKIGFSEGFQKFLDDNDKTFDIESDGFLTALVKSLEAIFDAAVDTQLKKGDEPFNEFDENPYKDDDGYLPIFEIKPENENTSGDGLVHIDLFSNPDVLAGRTEEERTAYLDTIQKLGFYTSAGRTVDDDGEAVNIIEVGVDIDQLVATAINMALGNPPETTVNPLDITFSLDDIFGEDKNKDGKTDDKDTEPDGTGNEGEEEPEGSALDDWLGLDASAELADFDGRVGTYISQKFALTVEDLEYQLFIEGSSEAVATFKASEGGQIQVSNLTENFSDLNGNDVLDYELRLTPTAKFFNDTQLGLNLGYTLDLLKTKLDFNVTLPGLFNGVLSTFNLPTGFAVEAGLGPLLRVEADLDLLSIDIFEDRFDFDAGVGSLLGSLAGVFRPGFTILTDDVDVVTDLSGADLKYELRGGDDVFTSAGGHDTVLGGAGNDRISVGDGDDVVWGGDGNDILSVGDGNNTVYGGDGDDVAIIGSGRGNNTFYMGAGTDTVRGGAGVDTIYGGSGDDSLRGGRGADVFVFTADASNETDTIADFGDGSDLIRLSDMSFADLVIRAQGGDTEVLYGNGNRLVLTGRDAATITAEYFDFV